MDQHLGHRSVPIPKLASFRGTLVLRTSAWKDASKMTQPLLLPHALKTTPELPPLTAARCNIPGLGVNQIIEVTAAQLAQTNFVVGAGGDDLYVRAYNGTNWSVEAGAWDNFDMTGV
jgi:hypothetical protein